MKSSTWQCALELRSDRSVASGSYAELCDAIRRGADLRVYTEFRHNEHIDTSSDNPELIQEATEFRVTYLLEDRWATGIMTLRQPVSLPDGFGPRPSMSFFLYNQDGQQAIARPHLDGAPATGSPGPSLVEAFSDMPKYHQLDSWDGDTNAPSHNFIYDFNVFRYWVRDRWREVLSHDANGEVISGSYAELAEAAARGCEVKVGIRGVCSDLAEGPDTAMDHEVFVHAHSSYNYTDRKLLIAGTHPVVRVRPGIPLRYTSRGWDFGWLMARTDGHVAFLLYDPYTLRASRRECHHAIRWFVGE